MADSVDRKACAAYMDDFAECMHHRKEAAHWYVVEGFVPWG